MLGAGDAAMPSIEEEEGGAPEAGAPKGLAEAGVAKEVTFRANPTDHDTGVVVYLSSHSLDRPYRSRHKRPLRGSVSCGSGWSVPCLSIQLTLSQESPVCRFN